MDKECGIIYETPKFPEYATPTKRMESFDKWPEYLPMKKESMVEAGFVYSGTGDSVRCFYCGGGLRNFEMDDEPMQEHAKWYPRCPYVRLVKGEAYIEKLARGEKPSAQSNNDSEENVDLITTVAAQTCLEYNYSETDIRKAIQIFIDKYSSTDFKAKDLYEILLEMEENPIAYRSDNTSEDVVMEAFEKEDAANNDMPHEGENDVQKLLEENRQLKENVTCKVCLDNKADVVFLPCGHIDSCAMCASALIKCPMCRVLVKGRVKVFQS